MGRKPKAVKNAEDKANVINVPVENMKDFHMTPPASLPSKKRLSMKINRFVRRSGRIRNKVLSRPNQVMRVEEIDVADSEPEDEPHIKQFDIEPQIEQFDSQPIGEQFHSEPPSNQQSLEDKVDFLVQSVKEFQSQGTKRSSPSETDPGELEYQSLYFASQKKIEALGDENRELVKELEFARGSAEAFKQMIDAFGNLKDLAIINNLGRVSEAIVNLSTQAAAGKFSLAQATNHDAPTPVAADGNKTAAPATHKRYSMRKR